MFNEKDQLAVNAIRMLAIEQIEKANSGHPGLPLGAAPMAYTLWGEHLNASAQNPKWINRDRFVLSAGHGSALLYSLLHLAGYAVSMEDLKSFRQLNSKTPGHPEYRHTDGVEATTGPLGQGIAQAVGMAMAEVHLAAEYNTKSFNIMDHYTYALVGDGDLMEGVSYEAMSFAGRQKLGKLIVLYDSNDISLDGDLNKAFTEDIKGRFEAQGWHYFRVEDGNDLEEISNAIEVAKAETDKPSLIEVKTQIGYGSPEAGTHTVHGSPLGEKGMASTKAFYHWTEDEFTVPAAAQAQFDQRFKERPAIAYAEWQKLFKAYEQAEPTKAASLKQAFSGDLPEDYDKALKFVDTSADAKATRATSSTAIQALAKAVPYLWGGSADLSGSNKTTINNARDFDVDERAGRNIWFGVREFAMMAMINGIALHGGSKIFAGTFFVFSDYPKAAIRIAALSGIPVTYVMTHDSIGVGEDGPTHEPIEQLAAFRAMPNLNVIRPADENEVYVAWKLALESQQTPTMLVLSRQSVPVLAHSNELAEDGVRKGAYVISAVDGQPDGILIATGSEVSLAIEAQALLKQEGINVSVVSMPSQNIFDQQDDSYKEAVLPSAVRNRMSIEMGATFGWERYVGLDGFTYGIDSFGKSGKGADVLADFGFTAEAVVTAYKKHFN